MVAFQKLKRRSTSDYSGVPPWGAELPFFNDCKGKIFSICAWIIGHLDQIDDFCGELLILARMKQIGTDIIARMLHEHHKCEMFAVKAIPGFNINSVSYEMLGPVFDNDYGVMYSFKLLNCVRLEFDPLKWNMLL